MSTVSSRRPNFAGAYPSLTLTITTAGTLSTSVALRTRSVQIEGGAVIGVGSFGGKGKAGLSRHGREHVSGALPPITLFFSPCGHVLPSLPFFNRPGDSSTLEQGEILGELFAASACTERPAFAAAGVPWKHALAPT
ncbi:hypothetical protein MRX96_035040 [Rhipicephalus microplus]